MDKTDLTARKNSYEMMIKNHEQDILELKEMVLFIEKQISAIPNK